MIVYTCPKCGNDLIDEVLACYPPINKTYCPRCGWSHSVREQIIRVPFETERVNIDLNYAYDKIKQSVCDTCSNNPKNGGSGICHCIMGSRPIKY